MPGTIRLCERCQARYHGPHADACPDGSPHKWIDQRAPGIPYRLREFSGLEPEPYGEDPPTRAEIAREDQERQGS